MNPPIKYLTQHLLNDVAYQSRQSPRLRQNYNFHQDPDKVQRFLNVLQPGTYIRPHRHLRAPGQDGFEFFLSLQGSLGLILFQADGEIIQKETISATGTIKGIELPEGTFHTILALEANTVILEIKEGPYNPQTDKEFLPQFPLEQTPEAGVCLQAWEKEFSCH